MTAIYKRELKTFFTTVTGWLFVGPETCRRADKLVGRNHGGLLQDPALPKEQRVEYAKAVTDASRRLADLIANILKLNKLENQQIFPSQTSKTRLPKRQCSAAS